MAAKNMPVVNSPGSVGGGGGSWQAGKGVATHSVLEVCSNTQ